MRDVFYFERIVDLTFIVCITVAGYRRKYDCFTFALP